MNLSFFKKLGFEDNSENDDGSELLYNKQGVSIHLGKCRKKDKHSFRLKEGYFFLVNGDFPYNEAHIIPLECLLEYICLQARFAANRWSDADIEEKANNLLK